MLWAAVLLPLFACCDGTNSTPLEEADGSKSEPIKPLRIAIIAPLQQSVPPKPGKYSDKSSEFISLKHEFDKEAEKTAKIVNDLVEGLVARGHQV
uniref:Secreted protein n=1 Tax=Globodera pallida TaxID=36090 RepID=A0A183CKG2_GLOPA